MNRPPIRYAIRPELDATWTVYHVFTGVAYCLGVSGCHWHAAGIRGNPQGSLKPGVSSASERQNLTVRSCTVAHVPLGILTNSQQNGRHRPVFSSQL